MSRCFPLDLVDRSITHKELYTVWWALKLFSYSFVGETLVHLGIDNQGAIACINRAWSTNPTLRFLAERIFEFEMSNNLQLDPVWVPSEDNYTPDTISREFIAKGEWVLQQWYWKGFLKLLTSKSLPLPSVDAFATKSNALLPIFCSRYLDTNSLGNFFFVNLTGLTIWCNPPYKILYDVLVSIRTRNLSAYVLVPKRQDKPWWHFISQTKATFDLVYNPLYPVFANEEIAQTPKWKSVVWYFSNPVQQQE